MADGQVEGQYQGWYGHLPSQGLWPLQHIQYTAHLMAPFNTGSIKLLKRVIGKVIEKAWLPLFHDIEDMEEKQWQHRMQSLEEEIADLKDSLTSTRESLEKIRDAFKEECKHAQNLGHALNRERKKTKSLEHELKSKKGHMMCLCSTSPHCSS